MAWWDDVAEAVGSGVGWVGDAAEAVVDTATEVVEEVTESATDAADAGLDALRDGAAAVGPALGAVANVVLGVVKGAVHAVADLAAISFDVVRNVGKLVSDVLHLNLADVSSDFPACSGTETTDACITDITRHMRDFGLDTDGDGVDDRPGADTGCGCTWRDTYPPFFSRLVLADELGHYFGLAHAGHNGVDKIMISTADGSSVLDSDSWWRPWLYGDAVFTEEDVEQTWRFIVKKMPHVLRAL